MPFELVSRPTPSGPSASARNPPITAVGRKSERRCVDHCRISAAPRKTSARRTNDSPMSLAVTIRQSHSLRAEQSSVGEYTDRPAIPLSTALGAESASARLPRWRAQATPRGGDSNQWYPSLRAGSDPSVQPVAAGARRGCRGALDLEALTEI